MLNCTELFFRAQKCQAVKIVNGLHQVGSMNTFNVALWLNLIRVLFSVEAFLSLSRFTSLCGGTSDPATPLLGRHTDHFIHTCPHTQLQPHTKEVMKSIMWTEQTEQREEDGMCLIYKEEGRRRTCWRKRMGTFVYISVSYKSKGQQRCQRFMGSLFNSITHLGSFEPLFV